MPAAAPLVRTNARRVTPSSPLSSGFDSPPVSVDSPRAAAEESPVILATSEAVSPQESTGRESGDHAERLAVSSLPATPRSRRWLRRPGRVPASDGPLAPRKPLPSGGRRSGMNERTGFVTQLGMDYETAFD